MNDQPDSGSLEPMQKQGSVTKLPRVPIEVGAAWHLPFENVTYNQDGLISMHNVRSLQSGRFADAYALAKNTGSWSSKWGQVDIHWRAHTLYWAAHQAANLPGDFVECGVEHGGTAVVAIEGLGRDAFVNRKFYLYDTFCGLDESMSSALELENMHEAFTDCYEEVKTRFLVYPFVEIVRGTVPHSLHQTAPNKVAYLHIDLNAEKPERAALEFFWDRLLPGAPVIFDDYAWIACAAQKRAIDAFLNPLGVEVLTLPTGQGMVIKQ